jgi:DNA polymerase-3 subunit gamma/tau
MPEVLYRKWRPQTLSAVVGQEHITQTLNQALKSGKVAHAYLFCGPRGTGKTSTARILAKAVNCLTTEPGEPCNACNACRDITYGRALDVVEIDAASNRGIDEIRELKGRIGFSPANLKYKVYIIDEVHMLTDAASNALLKTLEEPPPQVIFILATTEPHKVLPTILSRCQKFDFHLLSSEAIAHRLAHISKEEGISLDPGVDNIIARASGGSLRDAENILEQLTADAGKRITLDQAKEMLGFSFDTRVEELVRQIGDKNISQGIRIINQVTQNGINLRQFGLRIAEYLGNILVVKCQAEDVLELPASDREKLIQIASNMSLPEIVRAAKLFSEVNFQDYSPLPLELAFLQAIQAEDDSSFPAAEHTLLERIKEEWEEFIGSLHGTRIDSYLRGVSEPLDLSDDNTLTIGFQFPFHQEKVGSSRYRRLLEEKLAEKFGIPLRIQCVLKPGEESKESSPGKGHLVEAALKMGGKIVQTDD